MVSGDLVWIRLMHCAKRRSVVEVVDGDLLHKSRFLILYVETTPTLFFTIFTSLISSQQDQQGLRRMSQSPDISDDASSKKRKRQEDVGSKKSKRSKSIKNNDCYEDVDQVNNLNLALARLDPNLMADHIAKKQKRFEADATSLELEERRVSGEIWHQSLHEP